MVFHRRTVIIAVVLALLGGLPHLGLAALGNCELIANEGQIFFDWITDRWRQCIGGEARPVGQTAHTQGTATAMSGATVNVLDALGGPLIPVGTILSVNIEVLTAITGATAFKIGDGTHHARWGDNIAVAQGTTTTAADYLITSTPSYQTPTHLVLTAIGGNFTAGSVRVTVRYHDGSVVGSETVTDTNQLLSASDDSARGYLCDEATAGANITLDCPDVGAGNKKLRIAASGAATDNEVKITTADTTNDVLDNKLVAGNDLVKSINSPGGNETLAMGVGSWTKSIPFKASSWSIIGCPQAQETQLVATQGRDFYILGCTAGINTQEFHLTLKLPTNIDCTAPIQMRLYAIHTGSPASGQVTIRPTANFFGAGEARPNLFNAPGAAQDKTLTFTQQYVVVNMLTNDFKTATYFGGTCSAGDHLEIRLVIMGTLSTAVLGQVAFWDGELIYNMLRLDHQ